MRVRCRYEIHRLPLLKAFNDEPVLNMRELRQKVLAVKDGFLHFLLAEGKSIIFEAKACRESEQEIFQTYDFNWCPPFYLPSLI